MNQIEKHISAYIWDTVNEEFNILFVPNYLELVNNLFNLQKFEFIFSRSSQSKHSLVV
jgi:hypothetical protein